MSATPIAKVIGDEHLHGRHDAAHAGEVEVEKRETPALQAAEDDLRHQEAGDDEEHVDAGEAAGGDADAEMIEDDHRHRDGAQAVDVVAKVHAVSE